MLDWYDMKHKYKRCGYCDDRMCDRFIWCFLCVEFSAFDDWNIFFFVWCWIYVFGGLNKNIKVTKNRKVKGIHSWKENWSK